jgi:hypothetical protein
MTPQEKYQILYDSSKKKLSESFFDIVPRLAINNVISLICDQMLDRTEYIEAYLPTEFIKREHEFWTEVKKQTK